MEYGLWPYEEVRVDRDTWVLILVLMEYGLWHLTLYTLPDLLVS